MNTSDNGDEGPPPASPATPGTFGEKKSGVQEIGFDSSAFETLERDFQEVLTELLGDKSLERFRVEYEKLHRALKKSHESEKRLIKKCRELNSEIVSNAAKVQMALKLSQEDQNTIASLKKEIEKAWKMVDVAHEKETRAKETIQQLKLEINNLSRLVEQGAGLTLGQENTVNELMKAKDELTQERDAQVVEIVNLRNEIIELQERVRNLEDERTKAQADIQHYQDTIATKKAEAERESRRKERLEKELTESKQLLETSSQDVKDKQEELQGAQEDIVKLQQQLREQKASTEKAIKDHDQLNVRVQKIQRELDEQQHQNAQLQSDNAQRAYEVKVKEEEIGALKKRALDEAKLRDSLNKKIRDLEDKKRSVERDRDSHRQHIASLEREVEALQRQIDMDKKAIDDHVKQRELINNNLKKTENLSAKHQDVIKVIEGQKRNLEQEIAGYRAEAEKQRKLILQLESEREKYGQASSETMAKYWQAQEEVKIRDMKVIDLQKKITEGETKLKQQQNLYEAVRSDRNLYSKNLIECQDEIAEMKRKFKIMNHQIEQLKEEISAKDSALVKVHFEKMGIDKEKNSLTKELSKYKNLITDGEQTVSAQENEINKLLHIIKEADNERMRQKKELEEVMNERDILGTQLIRRNDELALLYEKIKIQQSTLQKGEIQYRERMEDIRVLKLKIGDLKRERHISKQQIANLDVLKKEVFHLQRELLQERTKVRALSEELETPLNVHRWRKLEGTDPSKMEMIQKIQTLQKRLITKTEEVVEKDMLIQEKEKLYVELKNILARQPGPEVAEQLSVYQQSLKEKVRQMKAMAAELNMYQAQVSEYKYEIERTNRDLQMVKKKYFEIKRNEQRLRSAGDADDGKGGAKFRTAPPQQRIAGGGFNLSQTKREA